MPLVLTLHGGGKKLDDLRELKGEVSLRELLEMKGLPASCTVGDWLRRMGRDGQGLSGLGKANQHMVAEILKRDKRPEYTLDTDATVIEAEKEEAKWTYKKEKGYQPLLGFLYETGLVLWDEFREGNIPAGSGAVEFLEACHRLMPKGKRIAYFRSDSAAYQVRVIEWCSEHKEAIKTIREEEWEPQEKDREIAETVHNREP